MLDIHEIKKISSYNIIKNTNRGKLVILTGLIFAIISFIGFLVASPYTIIPFIIFLFLFSYGWYFHQSIAAKTTTFAMTVSTILILGLISIYLILEAVPVFRLMGLEIVFKFKQPFWDTTKNIYSLVPMIWGTFLTTLIAMTIAGPLGIAGALFISEIAPSKIREIIKPGVETLAGIPSIVYGFIGYVIINPYMSKNFQLPTYGSLIVVGIVIGLMALPTVVSVAEDAINAIQDSTKNGSIALGTTDWQTMKSITLPAAISGIAAALLLGVGRAVGETMAATVIIGHNQRLPDPLYDIFGNTETLTSLIAAQYGNASGLHMKALFSAGVALFISVIILSVTSQYVQIRMKRKLRGKK